ncbi:MAG: triose-phosphate isomerase [Patescibacteria group bacterium]
MKTIIANWKMNVGTRGSVALARGILLGIRGKTNLPEIVICPSTVTFSEMRKVVAKSKVMLGAQNVFWQQQGAFTGEISVKMLAEHGVSHVIIGHSERRGLLGETDEMINKKVKTIVANDLKPIICVGEGIEDREAGKAREMVTYQVGAALEGLSLRTQSEIYFAYEPVWALSTSRGHEQENTADAKIMHELIRSVAMEHIKISKSKLHILYGGSVDSQNAYSFLREDSIDGVLVGGASLKLSQFLEIILAAADIIEGKQK